MFVLQRPCRDEEIQETVTVTKVPALEFIIGVRHQEVLDQNEKRDDGGSLGVQGVKVK